VKFGNSSLQKKRD